MAGYEAGRWYEEGVLEGYGRFCEGRCVWVRCIDHCVGAGLLMSSRRPRVFTSPECMREA